MSLWIIAGFAALTASAALLLARHLQRRLAALTQSYWELRYEYTRLRSEVGRLGAGHEAAPETADAAPQAQTSFVPLSSLKPRT
jgi:hypothetical protein